MTLKEKYCFLKIKIELFEYKKINHMQKNGSSDSYIIISLNYYLSIKVKAGLYRAASFEMFCIELQQLIILLWINLLFILLIE